MTSFSEIYNSLSSLSANERRKALIDEMSQLESNGIDCSSCEGICCSFIANSMKTTPLETLDLLVHLEDTDRLNDNFWALIQENIVHYRLDYDIDTGRGTSFRRTYTCPFYSPGAKGCSISRNSKPYGCLGFNAGRPNANGENGCAPDFDLLKRREDKFLSLEQKINGELKEVLGLTWEKLPIPVALFNIKNAMILMR